MLPSTLALEGRESAAIDHIPRSSCHTIVCYHETGREEDDDAGSNQLVVRLVSGRRIIRLFLALSRSAAGSSEIECICVYTLQLIGFFFSSSWGGIRQQQQSSVGGRRRMGSSVCAQLGSAGKLHALRLVYGTSLYFYTNRAACNVLVCLRR